MKKTKAVLNGDSSHPKHTDIDEMNFDYACRTLLHKEAELAEWEAKGDVIQVKKAKKRIRELKDEIKLYRDMGLVPPDSFHKLTSL